MRTRAGYFFMDKQTFDQPSLSILKQIELLKQRKLIINDSWLAEHFLKTIGYYRLKAYFQPFLHDNNSINGFQPDTTFSHILNLYIFDRELRLLMVDAIERIEVALRTALSNAMSNKFDPHWYLNPTLFANAKLHENFLKEVAAHLGRSKEDYIKDYYSRYHSPQHPPSWMVVECLSFGTVSKAYANIKDRGIRKEVGDTLGQYSEVLKSWMKALTYSRNICAHHARLWNRFFINKPRKVTVDHLPPHNASPFSMQTYIIIKLLNTIAPGNHWKERLLILFEEHESLVPFTEMGYSENWKNDSIWTL
jgi:abortive infection bacteriophage resistance protein